MDITETMRELSTEDGLSNSDKMVLNELFDTLPLDQQAVLAMNISGFRQWEISKILGISRTTVWSKHTKAIAALKQLIQGGDNGRDTYLFR